MQYRISTLVVIFSASTALAYLDCGGGRAPPKTTVPGCPGYVNPATVVSTSTATSSPSPYYYPDATSSAPSAEETMLLSSDKTGLFTVYEDPDSPEGCYCSGYLCEYAMPGCVDLDTTSTITANPGWETKTFDSAAYYSYIRTASAGGELSVGGYRIEIPTGTPTPQETTSGYVYSTSSKTGTVATGAASVTSLATSTISAYRNSTVSMTATRANVTVSSAAQTSVVVSNHNSASRVSGVASFTALLVSGAAAIVLL